jgi:nanoRNase/pAp phosphatase (c-di-AMP/oligoRNAs hydrolase)
MDDIKAKQQIVEKIKASTNILVTVSNDPSVDALSAALGLTLLLDKLDKHPTAIFSGAVPPAISFLEPEKTFDTTTDSLRDFIIALDKEKADHIRLSKEGDTVRIFITPYKTTITSDDLTFSQGDVTVELVIALGVTDQAHLDGALEAHGQILHDASIITVTAGDDVSTLGGIDWHDAQSSSLSEMISGLAEALKTDKTKPLLDKQIATALLTGIVAETDRFSNPHTTARVMTTAAQLMAGGADQQLIASKLEEMHEIGDLAINDESEKPVEKPEPETTSKDDLEISHKPNETLEEMDKRVKAAEQSQAAEVAGDALTAKTGEAQPETPTPVITDAYAPDPKDETAEPTLGGTLNATTEQAAEDNRNEREKDQNKTILSHSYMASSPAYSAPMNGAGQDGAPAPVITEILGHDAPGSTSVNDIPPTEGVSMNPAYAFDATPAAPASTATPAAPVVPPAPADVGLPMPPPLPDFSQSTPTITPDPVYGISPAAAAPATERLGDILAPEPPAPSAPSPTPPTTPSTPNDPTQFQIPTQP